MRSSTFDQDEAVALLRQLVAVRSYPGEERAAQQLVAAWLADNGLVPAGDFHQCSEWVDLTSLIPCAEVILATALTFLREQDRLSALNRATAAQTVGTARNSSADGGRDPQPSPTRHALAARADALERCETFCKTGAILMDWMWLIAGLVLGSLITSVLIWAQRGTTRQELPPGYFARVAQSVVITALLAGLARLGLDYATAGHLSATGVWFGGGWLLGGLLAGWLLSAALQSR